MDDLLFLMEKYDLRSWNQAFLRANPWSVYRGRDHSIRISSAFTEYSWTLVVAWSWCAYLLFLGHPTVLGQGRICQSQWTRGIWATSRLESQWRFRPEWFRATKHQNSRVGYSYSAGLLMRCSTFGFCSFAPSSPKFLALDIPASSLLFMWRCGTRRRSQSRSVWCRICLCCIRSSALKYYLVWYQNARFQT